MEIYSAQLHSQTVRARKLNFEKRFTVPHMSYVTCHVSCLMCQVTDMVQTLVKSWFWVQNSSVYFKEFHITISQPNCLSIGQWNKVSNTKMIFCLLNFYFTLARCLYILMNWLASAIQNKTSTLFCAVICLHCSVLYVQCTVYTM